MKNEKLLDPVRLITSKICQGRFSSKILPVVSEKKAEFI
jgi:hypothetical protein